jgi:hypothetical protein
MPGSNGLVLDSNLLLLLCVGRWRKDQIPVFKRTSKFEESDYDLLIYYLARFQRVVVTPNIITETSNLLGQLEGRYREEAFTVFNELISFVKEQYIPSSDAAQSGSFLKLGISDATIEQLAESGLHVLSDDFPLVGTLNKAGLSAINFAHLQSDYWAS